MRNKGTTEGTLIGLMVVVLVFIVPGIWVFRSHMEAQAYNRVTGANVSTWDAMWIELRATGDSSKDD